MINVIKGIGNNIYPHFKNNKYTKTHKHHYLSCENMLRQEQQRVG